MMELPATMTSARSLERPGMRRRIPGGVERSPLYQIAKIGYIKLEVMQLGRKVLDPLFFHFPNGTGRTTYADKGQSAAS